MKRGVLRHPDPCLLIGLLRAIWLAVCLALVSPADFAADKSGVTPNTISLPSGPGSIEGLGEAFQPTLNTGTGKYAVAFVLPPGTAGHAPELSISYEGGGGNGPLGFGWRYPLRYVQRQCDKGIPRYVDGPNGRDDDGDGEADESDEVDVFINEMKEELVPEANGDYFCENEGAFIRYRRIGDHWEGILPNGTRLEFGVTESGRVEVVEDGGPRRTYRWLCERATDTNGNTIVYRYRPFDGSGNLNQKYLDRIEYGPGAEPWENFHFAKCVYEDRPDWFEDCRSGFIVRTGRRVREVVIGTQGPDLASYGHLEGDFNGDGKRDYLDRKYVLEYQAHPHWSLLTRVTQVGGDGASTLPSLELGYTVCAPPDLLSARGRVIGSTNEPVQVMDSALVDLVDLSGDGLPDILQTFRGGGPHRVSINEGPVLEDGRTSIRWSPPRGVSSEDQLAWGVELESSDDIAHLADMDGDGLADLVSTTRTGRVYYFRNEGTVSWGNRVRMTVEDAPPPSPFGSAEVRTADIDFDKRMDVIQSVAVGPGAHYRIWYNLGEQRYSRSTTVPQENGRLFSTPGVHLADFNGDRVVDVAWVRPTSVIVTAGLGYGRFTEPVVVPLEDGALDSDLARRAALRDVSGDGLADLVIEGAEPGALWYWINLGNYRLTARKVITGMPRAVGATPEIRWADINGNGTTDYVLADRESSPRILAVDIGELMGCAPVANLLVSIDNGIGRRTEIDYAPSTHFATDDAQEGNPWPDPIPFPVHVVSEARVADSLGHVYTTRYRYHDGYYDPVEKEFRGFARMEMVQVGDETAPTLLTRHEFDTGRDVEALKGKLLRQSAEEEDGSVYWTEETTWATRTLATGTDGRDVVFAHPTANRKTITERGIGTPVTLEKEFEYDEFGNQTLLRDFGAVVGGDREALDDERFTAREFAINLERWIVRAAKRGEIRDEHGAVISRTETYYDDETFSGENHGEVSRGNVTLIREWFDPADPEGFVMSKRYRYDTYGNPVTILDPLATAAESRHVREIAYDSRFRTYPTSETVHPGAGSEPLVMRVAYDEGFGVVVESFDFDSNRTTYGYDALGRLVHIVEPLDGNEYPTTEYEYVLARPVGDGGVINFLESRQLDRAPGSGTGDREDSYFISRKFVDGLGRTVLEKEEAGVDPATGRPLVVARGAVLYNARGKPAATLQPYDTEIPGETLDELLAFEDVTSPEWRGIFHEGGASRSLTLARAHRLTVRYDAMLRALERTNPDGTQSVRRYEPLVSVMLDENDIDPGSPHFGTPTRQFLDGLGRIIRTDEIVRIADDGSPVSEPRSWTTLFTHDLNDRLTRITDAQGNVKTMRYDGLKRKTLMDDPDLGVVEYVYDAASNIVETIDAKGQRIVYTYDGANRLLSRNYLDRTGDPLTDPVDVTFTYDVAYDTVDLGDGSRGRTRNPRGALVRVEDLSGTLHFSHDERGREEWAVKIIPDPLTGVPAAYRTSFSYDSMNRLTAVTYPDNDRVVYDYNSRNLIERIRGSGDAGVTVVSGADYAPSGQPILEILGNGTTCEYAYDSRLRSTGIGVTSATGPGGALLSYAYGYDGVSNITSINDLREGPAVSGARRNSQRFGYDDLYRITFFELSDAAPDVEQDRGRIEFRYDRIGNLLRKSSPTEGAGALADAAEVNLGICDYAGGRSGRQGRAPGDPPGPHALTGTESGRSYAYDDNGNMIAVGGLAATWDYLNRLVYLEKPGLTARYVYDYDNRRTIKQVADRTGTRHVLYVNQYFEVREGEAPTKFVYAGTKRAARVKGTLSPERARIQRIRLFEGWNAVSLCVDPGPAEVGSLLGLGTDPAIEAVYAQDRGGFILLTPGSRVEVGTPLWVSAQSPRVISVLGRYAPEADATTVPAGRNVLAWPRLEGLYPRELLDGVDRAWVFDNASGGWLLDDFKDGSIATNLTGARPPGSVIWTDGATEGRKDCAATRDENVLFYHADHLGSTDVVTDLSGTVVEETHFYPYGSIRFEYRATEWFQSDYRHTGKEHDRESGLYCYGSRYYDPVVGRFTNVDPLIVELEKPDTLKSVLGNPQKLNLYSYVLNNPIIYTDPSGLEEGSFWSNLFKSGAQRRLEQIKSGEYKLTRMTNEMGLKALGDYGTKEYHNKLVKPAAKLVADLAVTALTAGAGNVGLGYLDDLAGAGIKGIVSKVPALKGQLGEMVAKAIHGFGKEFIQQLGSQLVNYAAKEDGDPAKRIAWANVFEEAGETAVSDFIGEIVGHVMLGDAASDLDDYFESLKSEDLPNWKREVLGAAKSAFDAAKGKLEDLAKSAAQAAGRALVGEE